MSDYSEILATLNEEGRLRRIPPHRKGRFLDLSGNDYMGLAAQAGKWREEFAARFNDVAMSASASRLLASDQQVFHDLEAFLEKSYGRPALMFNSGYHANVGLVSSLDIPGTLWVTDKLIHASAIDGLRLAHADYKRWRHNDVAHLRRILEQEHDARERLIVLCESVYSMDGDIAPLREIAALKKEFPKMMLYVDEAHAVGAFGAAGLGVAEGLLNDLDILVGTLGKACASVGAFAVISPVLKEYLVNCARSLIFSTAIAPANAAWSLLMLEKLQEMNARREHLGRISRVFREGIETLTGMDNPSRSAIVPLVTGDARKAVRISQELEQAGILALPIRRPTVPPGGERIRFSLNATLSEATVADILNRIEDCLNLTK